jgi:hypothetical protein
VVRADEFGSSTRAARSSRSRPGNAGFDAFTGKSGLDSSETIRRTRGKRQFRSGYLFPKRAIRVEAAKARP